MNMRRFFYLSVIILTFIFYQNHAFAEMDGALVGNHGEELKQPDDEPKKLCGAAANNWVFVAHSDVEEVGDLYRWKTNNEKSPLLCSSKQNKRVNPDCPLEDMDGTIRNQIGYGCFFTKIDEKNATAKAIALMPEHKEQADGLSTSLASGRSQMQNEPMDRNEQIDRLAADIIASDPRQKFEAARLSMFGTIDNDPNKWVEAVKVAKAASVPPEVAERNLEKLKREIRINGIAGMEITPELSEFLGVEHNAKYVSDDFSAIGLLMNNIKHTGQSFQASLEMRELSGIRRKQLYGEQITPEEETRAQVLSKNIGVERSTGGLLSRGWHSLVQNSVQIGETVVSGGVTGSPSQRSADRAGSPSMLEKHFIVLALFLSVLIGLSFFYKAKIMHWFQTFPNVKDEVEEDGLAVKGLVGSIIFSISQLLAIIDIVLPNGQRGIDPYYQLGGVCFVFLLVIFLSWRFYSRRSLFAGTIILLLCAFEIAMGFILGTMNPTGILLHSYALSLVVLGIRANWYFKKNRDLLDKNKTHPLVRQLPPLSLSFIKSKVPSIIKKTLLFIAFCMIASIFLVGILLSDLSSTVYAFQESYASVQIIGTSSFYAFVAIFFAPLSLWKMAVSWLTAIIIWLISGQLMLELFADSYTDTTLWLLNTYGGANLILVKTIDTCATLLGLVTYFILRQRLESPFVFTISKQVRLLAAGLVTWIVSLLLTNSFTFEDVLNVGWFDEERFLLFALVPTVIVVLSFALFTWALKPSEDQATSPVTGKNDG